MPKAKPAAARQPAREPIALYYTGDASGQPSIHGIPARDLTRADIARLAYVEGTRTAKRVSAKAITDRLAETAVYRRTNPARSTPARKPAARAAQPAAPAAVQES